MTPAPRRVVVVRDLADLPLLGADDLLRVVGLDLAVVAAAMTAKGYAVPGLWVDVDEQYAAALAARDVATLAQLSPLHDVVVHADELAPAHAAALAALLTNDVVTFVNEVATYQEAVNRPAPPNPIRVGFVEGEELVFPDHRDGFVLVASAR